MWQRFTDEARKVVFFAQEEAQNFGEGYVSTEHLLLGLCREPGETAAKVLERLGVSINRIRIEMEKQLPQGDGRPSSDMTLTPRAKRVIDLAYQEARKLGDNAIGSEHLLLGMVHEGDGLAGKTLAKLGVGLERTRKEVQALRDGVVASPPDAAPARVTPPIDPWDGFADSAKRAVDAAERETQERGHSYLCPEHLLLGILADGNGTAVRALAALGLDLGELQEATVRQCRPVAEPRAAEVTLSPATQRAIQIAYDEQRWMAATEIGAEHILIGLLREPDGAAGRVMSEMGVEVKALRSAIQGVR